MYTASNYFWGMVAYYVGALVVIWYLWWLLASIPYRHGRNLLLLLGAAVLFTPVQAYPDSELPYLAPAFLVYAFENLVFDATQDRQRALLPMLFVYLVLLASYGGWQWWWHWRKPKR